MNYKIMKRWVKALRSGKYKKIKGTLATKKGHCCLGVLCEVLKLPKIYDMRYRRYYFVDSYITLPAEALVYFKGGSLNISVPSLNMCLIDLNDRKGYSFKRIADIIEKHWKEL